MSTTFGRSLLRSSTAAWSRICRRRGGKSSGTNASLNKDRLCGDVFRAGAAFYARVDPAPNIPYVIAALRVRRAVSPLAKRRPLTIRGIVGTLVTFGRTSLLEGRIRLLQTRPQRLHCRSRPPRTRCLPPLVALSWSGQGRCAASKPSRPRTLSAPNPLGSPRHSPVRHISA